MWRGQKNSGARRSTRGLINLIPLLSFSLLTQCWIRPHLSPADVHPHPSPADDVHPNFSFTEEQVAGLIQQLPRHSQRQAEKYPFLFLDLLFESVQLPDALTVLVDKSHALRADYTPPDLVELERYGEEVVTNVAGIQVSHAIIPDLLAMVRAARQSDIVLDISSGYRSYSYQEGLYRRHVENMGAEEANRVSARAGHSQHQLGTAVDFGSVSSAFDSTAAAAWLRENAWYFGFSISYPHDMEHVSQYRHESWHWRYIGTSAALLERYFFDGVQQYMLVFLHANRDYITENLIVGGEAE